MPNHDQLLDSAETLRAQFYSRADEIENARRIPADISAAMAQAGFYRLGAPQQFGGLETPPAISSRIFETLARGDASCAWVAFIGTTSSTALASIPAAAATAVFPNPDTLITGVFAPRGTAEKVAGGFRVSGRWQWGSGSQNAAYIMGGCMLKEGGEPMLDKRGNPRNHMMIVPKDDVEFIDTWHVAGLQGSGSLDYQVKDVFVPEEHAVGYFGANEAASGPLYVFPNFTFLALGIGAVCLGIARAAIDELVELAVSKRRVSSSKTIAEHQVSQMTLAQAEADLRSARLFYYDALDTAWKNALAGERVSLDQRRNLRLAVNNAVTKSVRVVDDMYELGGGSAIYKTSRLQRQFRDIHVARSHIMVSSTILETTGRLFFGLDANVATL